MKPFIFESRNQIYIINLGETVKQLNSATDFLTSIARRKGKILFVGCKKQAQEAVKEAALACGQYYVNQRWLGGTLTNLATIRKSMQRLNYIENIEKAPEYKMIGKKELAALSREGVKLQRNLGGIREMDRLPDAIIIIDTARELNAVAEARRLKIPTVAIVDTNADPTLITHPIAGNDDAIRAIRVVLAKLVDAVIAGGGEGRNRTVTPCPPCPLNHKHDSFRKRSSDERTARRFAPSTRPFRFYTFSLYPNRGWLGELSLPTPNPTPELWLKLVPNSLKLCATRPTRA